MCDFGKYLKDRNAFVFGNEPLIFHCHHYNCFFQKSIEDTRKYIDVYPILINSAHELVYSQFSNYFKENNNLSINERKRVVEKYYSFCGFGKIGLKRITTKGGHVKTPYEHYSINWSKKFGTRKDDEPGVSFFTLGFLCGAAEAIFDIPLGTFSSKQDKCLSKGDDICKFEIFRGLKKNLHPSPGEGEFQVFDALPNPSDTSVDYDSIRESFINMPIQGDSKTGLIDAFGVSFTRHYANYYCLVSIRILIELEKKHGKDGIHIAKSLMIEAGEVCAFNTLGGIMLSTEWESLIMPMIKSHDDWVHGIVACVNALGWGRWEIEILDSEGDSVFNIISAYESNSFLKMVGKSKEPICYLLEGCLSGIMNLLYHGDITQKPQLDEAFYNEVFKTKGKFEAKESSTRMMGADEDKINVKRIS